MNTKRILEKCTDERGRRAEKYSTLFVDLIIKSPL
jgi:hypothetical protein